MACALPFLAAIAADDIEQAPRCELVTPLGHIALGASFATEVGYHAGAFGEGADALIPDAITRGDQRFRKIATVAPELAGVVRAIVAIASEPRRATYDALRAALGDDHEDEDPVAEN